MQEELKKSLTDLIDETLLELEELKKSRFSASEVEIKGPGADELAGKPVNGKLAEKAEDKKEDEDKKDEDEAEKAEGVNGVLKAEDDVEKAEDKKDDEKAEDKAEDKKDEPKAEKKDDKKDDKDEKPSFPFKKSLDESEALMKSYVDQKVAPLESKLSTILDMVTKLSDQPVPAKGVSYKGVAPLMKSNEAMETLSKSEVASKLFDLKKSGTRVDSNDIVRAEMGHDLEKIVEKYNIK